MILEGRFINVRLAIRRRLYFLYKPFFKHFGKRAMIYKPIMLKGSRCIEIGDYSFIFAGARIEVLDKKASLSIGSCCSFEQRLHLICHENIIIGNSCMVSANCMISDVNHSLSSIDTPYNKQELITDRVEIGDNVFIGMGTTILPGTKLGNNVVVGANSVVKGTFEDNVMIAGSPAKIIKRYDSKKMRWEHV